MQQAWLKSWYMQVGVLMLAVATGLTCYLNKTRVVTSQKPSSRTDLAARHLSDRQNKDGHFDYDVDFVDGHLSDKDNIVRQAGAIYGLGNYLEKKRDPKVEAAIGRAIERLYKDSIPFSGGALISDGGSLQSAFGGSTALALLGELYYAKFTGDNRYRDIREKWLSGLLGLVSPEYGFYKYPGAKEECPYYNGEAWLALTYYHGMFPNDLRVNKILAHVDDHMIEVYSEDPHKGFMHWGMMATTERYFQTHEAQFLEFGKAQAQTMLSWKAGTDMHRYNSCYQLEGLIPVTAMVKRAGGDPVLLNAMNKHIEQELRTNFKLQVLNPTAVANAKIIGAFRDGADTTRCRVDSTQHCLSALLKAEGLQELPFDI